MTQNANGLWSIVVGKEEYFTELDYDEAVSGLLFVGCMLKGVCSIEGKPVYRFV